MAYIQASAALCALGSGKEEILSNLKNHTSPGLHGSDKWLTRGRTAYVGEIMTDVSAVRQSAVMQSLPEHNSRNNALLLLSLNQIRAEVDKALESFGPGRFGIVMGTSTSGLDEADHEVSAVLHHEPPTLWHYYMQELGDPSRFLQKVLKTSGPCYTISTACSSSARALISGCRLIKSGLCDAVLCGGADTLSRMPINGFDSMGVLSPNRCLPFCKDRNGINIGEAAGLMLLTKTEQELSVLGYGESSDAYHASAPDPTAAGAIAAMHAALKMADLKPRDIGYINLHGTATKMNDSMESAAVAGVFGENTPCSSTKYLTGHTLGAAGILESVLMTMLLESGQPLPPQDFSLSEQDPELKPCGLLREAQACKSPYMLSNSFAFGGNNAAILIGASK